MNAKEQWRAYYEHRYTNNKVPDMRGLALFPDAIGLGETIKGTGLGFGKDWFGAEWITDESINEVLPDPRAQFVLEDIADWREKVILPDLEAFDWEAAVKKDWVDRVDRENKFLVVGINQGPWERLHTLMGFENALVALMIDPDECEAFFAHWLKWRLRLLEKVKEFYNPDVIMYHDDAGTQKDLFFSPELWRRLFKPLLKAAVDKCHELGMFFEYHTCGKIERIALECVEVGVDVLQCQEINDISKLKSQTESKITYHAFADYQSLVVRANEITEDEVRATVRENFVKNLEGGQYAPLMLPYGDWVTDVMFEELMFNLCAEFQGEPEG